LPGNSATNNLGRPKSTKVYDMTVPPFHTCSPRHSLFGLTRSAKLMAYHLEV
jgi:hypothetical protein